MCQVRREQYNKICALLKKNKFCNSFNKNDFYKKLSNAKCSKVEIEFLEREVLHISNCQQCFKAFHLLYLESNYEGLIVSGKSVRSVVQFDFAILLHMVIKDRSNIEMFTKIESEVSLFVYGQDVHCQISNRKFLETLNKAIKNDKKK